MKCIPVPKYLLVAAFAGMALAAGAQFNGKLTYAGDNPVNTVNMIYYQNGNNARVDCWSQDKKDTTNINHQDTLLFDLAAKTTTHLVYLSLRAVIAPNTATITQQAMAGSPVKPVTTIQTVGAETVNGYSCTHFLLTTTNGHYSSKRDIWITQSLGTPGIQVIAAYLYFTPDNDQEIQLLSAGGAGVVVREVMSAPGLTTSINLVAVDTRTPDLRLFSIPSRYTVVDNSKYVFKP